jgi:serine-type D-Ala-D-Ala endopeptidase (penicillin-binding protein 7)
MPLSSQAHGFALSVPRIPLFWFANRLGRGYTGQPNKKLGGRVRILVAFLAALALFATPALARELRQPSLKSQAALVVDQDSGEVLLGKNAESTLPIASLTKLMTAIVTLDAELDPGEPVTVTKADVDRLRGSHSRLQVGTTLSRDDMLHLALMASENRAASAIANSYPGGKDACVLAMNLKAQLLGMNGTRFEDGTGLSGRNVSTAQDLAKLVEAAHAYPKIRDFTTSTSYQVKIGHRAVRFGNTNNLTRSSRWEIGLSKTGYIAEAGRCLVMQVTLAGRSIIIVLLDSWGKYTRVGDATRIRQWLEFASSRTVRSSASLLPKGEIAAFPRSAERPG